jgi:multicomponent Na+:H+ antiporter subunit E
MPAGTGIAVRDVRHSRWLRVIRRGALFSLLWLLLAGGTPAGWVIGVPAVATATLLSLRLWSGPTASLPNLVRFSPWFIRESIAGAVDVASRALRPSMPLHPGVVTVRLRLPSGASRVALANVVSMLPGTLSAGLESDRLTIHALDARQDLGAMVRDLEPRIAGIFNVDLAARPRTEAAS